MFAILFILTYLYVHCASTHGLIVYLRDSEFYLGPVCEKLAAIWDAYTHASQPTTSFKGLVDVIVVQSMV